MIKQILKTTLKIFLAVIIFFSIILIINYDTYFINPDLVENLEKTKWGYIEHLSEETTIVHKYYKERELNDFFRKHNRHNIGVEVTIPELEDSVFVDLSKEDYSKYEENEKVILYRDVYYTSFYLRLFYIDSIGKLEQESNSIQSDLKLDIKK